MFEKIISRKNIILFLFISILGYTSITTAQNHPEIPYVFEDMCPFECCTYGNWKAEDVITVYPAQDDTTQIKYKIEKGEKFLAETGNVILKEPGIVEIKKSCEIVGQDSPEKIRKLGSKNALRKTIPPGDTLYVMSYIGEGIWNVWYGGIFSVEDGGSWLYGMYKDNRSPDNERIKGIFIKKPVTEWWVKIKYKGKEGWIFMKNARVIGADACG